MNTSPDEIFSRSEGLWQSVNLGVSELCEQLAEAPEKKGSKPGIGAVYHPRAEPAPPQVRSKEREKGREREREQGRQNPVNSRDSAKS